MKKNNRCIGCSYLRIFYDGRLMCNNEKSKFYNEIVGYICGCDNCEKEDPFEDDLK